MIKCHVIDQVDISSGMSWIRQGTSSILVESKQGNPRIIIMADSIKLREEDRIRGQSPTVRMTTT